MLSAQKQTKHNENLKHRKISDACGVHAPRTMSAPWVVCRAVAYVCHNFTCKAPTSDPAKVKELLREDHPSRPNSSTAPSAVPRLSEIDISSIITSSKS